MPAREVAALAAMAVVVASLLVVMGCGGEKKPVPEPAPESEPYKEDPRLRHFEVHKVECMMNVRNLTGLVESTAFDTMRYPNQSGANFILYFVKKGEIEGENLKILFCPSDPKESLEAAGGADAYKDIDLKKHEYGHLTSYAGRNQADRKYAAKPGDIRSSVLVADDSGDHHLGRGFVVGLTGGAVKWRDKVGDYRRAPDEIVEVGEKSAVDELRCLRAD